MYVCIYTCTHTDIDKISSVKFFIKNKPFHSSALHWIAKYLRNFILLGIRIVCMSYRCMCMCTCVHTHATHTDLKSTCWLPRAKRRACFPTEGGRRNGYVSGRRQRGGERGGQLRPAFLGKDFEQDGRRLRGEKGEEGGGRAEGKLRT